jgi:nucleoid DNA-binding protein/cell division septation protein DedD
MEISQHIKNLLKTNSRVILKNFGAFETKHISAVIDKDTKVMKPPFKIVVFTTEFKQDSGLLLKYMAEHEQISIDSAAEQIEEYVKTLKSKLDSGQTFECKDLGKFVKGIDGSYEFSFLSDENLLIDSYGLPIVSMSEQDKVTPRPEVIREQSKKELETKNPEVKEEIVTPPIKKEQVVKENIVKENIVKEKVVKEKVVKEKPIKQKPVKDPLTGEQPKKKGRGWLVLLIIVGVIAVFLTAVYFLKPDYWTKGYDYTSEKFTIVKSTVSGWFNKDKDKYEIIEKIEKPDTNTISGLNSDTVDQGINESENETETNTETNTETETVTNETETETVVENNTLTPPSKTGKYHIIVGSLETEADAKQEQKRFTKKGINTDIIHVPALSRYRISAGAFKTPKEAQDYFAELQKKYEGLEAWVWEKK